MYSWNLLAFGLLLVALGLFQATAEPERFLPKELTAVPPGVAATFPLPLPVQGSCTAGTDYTITHVKDLYTNIGDLECIFAAGQSPEGQIPLGFSYGYLLTAANTAFWSPVAEIGYQGDFVVRTQCQSQYYYIGWLSILGLKVGTATWTTGNFLDVAHLAAGEYPIGTTEGIIMDFTTDFKALCSPEGNESPIGLKGFSPFKNSIFPISTFIDFARVVGRDINDGGIITLNKAYFVPPEGIDGARTVLFYATKNFDPNFRPDFANPGPQTITVPPGPNGEMIIPYSRGTTDGVLQIVIEFTKVLSKTPSLNLTALPAKAAEDISETSSAADVMKKIGNWSGSAYEGLVKWLESVGGTMR